MVVLGVLLLVLKLAEFGPFGDWSYWAVLWPFGLAVIWWAYADATGLTKRREIEKMDKVKQDRIDKNKRAIGMKVTPRK